MTLADGLDVQPMWKYLDSKHQSQSQQRHSAWLHHLISGHNKLWNFRFRDNHENTISLVPPTYFKQSSKTCREIRTKISPFHQNHKQYKMFTAVLIASLGKMYWNIMKPTIFTLQSHKHTSYIPSFLIPNLSPHWRWSAANRNQAPGNALWLASYHIWYIDVLMYIDHIHQIYMVYSYNWQLGPVANSVCSIYHARKSVLAKVHLSILCALTLQLVYDLRMSAFGYFQKIWKTLRFHGFRSAGQKQGPLHFPLLEWEDNTLIKLTHQIPSSQNAVSHMLQDDGPLILTSCTKLGT